MCGGGVSRLVSSTRNRYAIEVKQALFRPAGNRGQIIHIWQSYSAKYANVGRKPLPTLVVARDVVERHNVARPRVASLFAQRLLGTNARQLSLRKAANDLRSAGLSTTKETLGDLLSYFQEAYLVFGVKQLSYSLSESTTSQPRIYAIGPGLALACAKAQTVDAGQRLEDAVYLELRRRMAPMRRDRCPRCEPLRMAMRLISSLAMRCRTRCRSCIKSPSTLVTSVPIGAKFVRYGRRLTKTREPKPSLSSETDRIT